MAWKEQVEDEDEVWLQFPNLPLVGAQHGLLVEDAVNPLAAFQTEQQTVWAETRSKEIQVSHEESLLSRFPHLLFLDGRSILLETLTVFNETREKFPSDHHQIMVLGGNGTVFPHVLF